MYLLTNQLNGVCCLLPSAQNHFYWSQYRAASGIIKGGKGRPILLHRWHRHIAIKSIAAK